MRKITLGLIMSLFGCGEGPTIVAEPLQIVHWMPTRGAQCVATETSLFRGTVTFSADIDPSTLDAESVAVMDTGGHRQLSTLAYDKATQTVTLTLLADLEHSVPYDFLVTDTIRGAAGEQLGTTQRSSFTTISGGGCF